MHISEHFNSFPSPFQGHGWWKYEFCYSRHVRQFHVDKNGDESSIVLGKYNPKTYREWLVANPQKGRAMTETTTGSSSQSRSLLWTFYGEGTQCELTGRPRHTEVKLRCTHPTLSVTASTVKTTSQLYLLEPETCEYVLSVESPLVCELLRHIEAEEAVEGVSEADDELKVVTWTV